MDSGNMRFQEGFLFDRMKVRIGVIGISRGAGASFVARGLNYHLNLKGAPKVFVSRNDRYEITDEPEDWRDQDFLIGVIDPLPSRLVEGAAKYAALKEHGDIIWIINKDNDGVDHRELERFLDLDKALRQEALPYEMLCRAEYNCEKPEKLYRLGGIEKLAETIAQKCSEG